MSDAAHVFLTATPEGLHVIAMHGGEGYEGYRAAACWSPYADVAPEPIAIADVRPTVAEAMGDVDAVVAQARAELATLPTAAAEVVP